MKPSLVGIYHGGNVLPMVAIVFIVAIIFIITIIVIAKIIVIVLTMAVQGPSK